MEIQYFRDSCLNSGKYIAEGSVDLFFCDPPYFITKKNDAEEPDLLTGDRYDWDTQWKSKEDFYEWSFKWIQLMYSQLKPDGSAYVCAAWQHSGKIQELLEQAGFIILNRITWKRDKGRGAARNWKSMHEDIWYVSKNRHYTFNLDAVKVEKEVIAPYRNADGTPKDWFVDETGKKLRLTHPGNLWTQFTIPFWSMREVKSYAKTKKTPDNTLQKHNAQKPKDLVKMCIEASSNPGDLVVDYFIGAGTTAIAAAELGRRCIALDINKLCIDMLEARIRNELIIDKHE